MSNDEGFESQFGKSDGGRHAPVVKKDIDTFELTRNEKNTVQQTKWALNCFTSWCQEKSISVDFMAITKERLNEVLRDFYGTVRNGKGENYGISSYISLRSGLNRHVSDPPLSLCWCLMKDSAFTSSNNVFVGVVKTLRRQGRDTTEHHPSISASDFNTIKSSLDPTKPEGLIRKVWFDVQLHFGRRGKEGNRQLTPASFSVFRDENGLKYASMTFNEETKNHKDPQERKKDSRRGYMYSLCPVASLEKYLSLLPSNAPALYLHPKRKWEMSDDIW
ncbi:hypothetical protein SKAU_G00194590 [Synaphobranchus kaupii]|uniref:DUF3504 domain-containing protein n=1 Tax=Synaphobranchus kaupii TaxID=118154 RepID=A0A9Q1IXR3_SYNKA|nr:hypothetical protein SKAU_G00194590 [Synaphobranchus kaupii]